MCARAPNGSYKGEKVLVELELIGLQLWFVYFETFVFSNIHDYIIIISQMALFFGLIYTNLRVQIVIFVVLFVSFLFTITEG